MKIILKYFASVREQVGVFEEEITVPDGLSTGNLMDFVRDLHEPLQQTKEILMAINGEYVSKDHILRDGDVIALFPPVSGG
jgi:molybdopterin synthase sulfur carrier subunit